MGVIFHPAVIEDDGVGTDVATVPNSEAIRLQDPVLEKVRLQNTVLVEARVVSDSDEVELYQPRRMYVDTLTDFRP